MRTLLVGTDFMYNSNGDLLPIEINTNVGLDDMSMIEYSDSVFDLSDLTSFILNNNFKYITYIGGMDFFSDKLKNLCDNLTITYSYVRLVNNLTIPYIEDDLDHLIIRSSYDATAIVDEEYCKVKTNFLKLIKNQSFASKFAYLDDNGIIVNNIDEIVDNGIHPNLILKPIYPNYDRKVYPKLFRVSNLEELNQVLQHVDGQHYLTIYYFNQSKLYSDHIKIIRSLNLLIPPTLNSIKIGAYGRLAENSISNANPSFDETFELIDSYNKTSYLTTYRSDYSPKLLDTDIVQMSDCSYKTALELQVDDIVKTVILPGNPNLSYGEDTYNYNITYDELVSGTTYTNNKILAKYRVDKLSKILTIYFNDNTTWEDTSSSLYLVETNGIVSFKYLEDLTTSDSIILLSTDECDVINFTKKIISRIEFRKEFFGGWEITVNEQHLFLTRNDDSVGNTSYLTIEHNVNCDVKNCTPGPPGEVGGCTNYCSVSRCCISGICSINCV